MINSKIFALIRSFKSKDLKPIHGFLSADFNKSNYETVGLFKYLRACIDKNHAPNKEAAFDISFPNEKYDDNKLRILFTKTLKQLEQFIVYNTLEEEAFSKEKSIVLQKYYRKNQLDKLFKSESSKFKKDIAAQHLESYDALELRYQSELEIYEFTSKEGRKQDLNLNTLLELSEVLFYARKIKLACFAIAHAAVYSQAYDFEDFQATYNIIQKKGLYKNIAIGVYYYGYQVLTNPEDALALEQYKDYIYKHQDRFSQEENRTLFFIAINSCIKLLNSGKKEYGVLGLKLYENALQTDILLVDGNLSRFTFRNIAMMAIRSNQIDWAENFSHQYSHQLRKQDRNSAYNFNLALVAFFQGDFPNALIHIQEADFKDHLIHLAAKSLHCKIYFELKEFDALDFLIEAMEIYIRRNKVIGYHKQSYLNTTKYFKKLNRLNFNDKDKVKKLRKAISNEKPLLEKTWFLEKLK